MARPDPDAERAGGTVRSRRPCSLVRPGGALEPRDTETMNNMAAAQSRAGDLDGAMSTLQQATQVLEAAALNW